MCVRVRVSCVCVHTCKARGVLLASDAMILLLDKQ